MPRGAAGVGRMTSIDSILKIAISGLNTSQAAIKTTSDNIANVNTEGYARQIVEQETRLAGSEASGVQVARIRRITDAFLERELRDATADTQRYAALSALHDRLQTVLGRVDDESNFARRLDTLFGGISQPISEPDSATRRLDAINDLTAFANEVSRTAKQIQELRAEADRQIQEAVVIVNNAIQRIADLNPRIAFEKSTGGDPSALEEQRARAIAEIAEYVDLQLIEASNNFLTVSTSTGITLVDTSARKLVYSPPGVVAAATRFPQITVNRVDPVSGAAVGTGQSLDPNLRSGKLRGLLDARNTEFVNLGNELGEFSSAVIDRLNAVHNDNTAVPPPASLTGRQTGIVSTDADGFTGKVTFATISSTNTLVNRIEIDFTNNTRSVNGAATTALSGSTIGTLITDVNAALGANTLTLTAGVLKFTAPGGSTGVSLLQDSTTGSARGDRGFSHFFGLNDLMQASVATTFETGFTGTDAHQFANGGAINLQLRGPNSEIAKDVTVTFPVGGSTFADIVTKLNTDFANFGTFALDSKGALGFTPVATLTDYRLFVPNDTTNRGSTGLSLSSLFGLGPSFQPEAASGVKVVDRIANDNKLLALARLDTTATGTTPALTVGDARGALALQAVREERIAFGKTGNIGSQTTTLGDYGAAVLSDFATRAQQAESFLLDRDALRVVLQARTSDVSGVNLDEELGNMILFQNAYNASARMIATARQLFDVLLEVAG